MATDYSDLRHTALVAIVPTGTPPDRGGLQEVSCSALPVLHCMPAEAFQLSVVVQPTWEACKLKRQRPAASTGRRLLSEFTVARNAAGEAGDKALQQAMAAAANKHAQHDSTEQPGEEEATNGNSTLCSCCDHNHQSIMIAAVLAP